MTPRAVVAIALGLCTFMPGPGIQASIEPHRVLVTVVDNRSKPVTGLRVLDFQVLIDDVPQEIISVEPATDPVSVVILTDRLGLEAAYSPFDLSRALRSFVKTLTAAVPGSQFALTTFDGPVVRVASFGLPPAELDRILGRLATVARDSALRDAVMDVCQTVRTAPTPRRAIFTVFAGYRPDMSTTRSELVGRALEVCGASWWAVEARSTGENSFGNSDREMVVDRGTALSGGTREVVASAIGVETMSKRMAEFIAAQYAVSYAATQNTRSNGIRKVIVSRKDVRVYAPAWVGRQ